MLILQRNVFCGGGILLLLQAHTTLGMAAIIMVVTSAINKVMLQVQVSSLIPKLLNTDKTTRMFRSIV